MLINMLEMAKENREDVGCALLRLAERDADFCGDNGYDYLWEAAEGFETNAEYALSVAEKEPTIIEMVVKFVSMWMDHDSFYEDYDLAISNLDGIIGISIAYTTD